MYNICIAILDHGSSRACAMGACESCQDLEVAALSGNLHVPRGTRGLS